jgi:hypothetical protein
MRALFTALLSQHDTIVNILLYILAKKYIFASTKTSNTREICLVEQQHNGGATRIVADVVSFDTNFMSSIMVTLYSLTLKFSNYVCLI